jgi:RNA recognition motif-containing protein
MGSRLFVGNLPYSATDDSLMSAFEKFGSVKDCRIIMDRETGKSKGYGFIEMASDEEAAKAVVGMNATEMDGRKIGVSEARPRAEKPTGQGGKNW